jgi:hypothetical protein
MLWRNVENQIFLVMQLHISEGWRPDVALSNLGYFIHKAKYILLISSYCVCVI